MTVEEVYVKLLMNKDAAEFQEKYSKIMMKKAERESKAKRR